MCKCVSTLYVFRWHRIFGRRQILGNSNRARSSCASPSHNGRWSGSDTCCDDIIILLYATAALHPHTRNSVYCNIIIIVIMCDRATIDEVEKIVSVGLAKSASKILLWTVKFDVDSLKLQCNVTYIRFHGCRFVGKVIFSASIYCSDHYNKLLVIFRTPKMLFAPHNRWSYIIISSRSRLL